MPAARSRSIVWRFRSSLKKSAILSATMGPIRRRLPILRPGVLNSRQVVKSACQNLGHMVTHMPNTQGINKTAQTDFFTLFDRPDEICGGLCSLRSNPLRVSAVK